MLTFFNTPDALLHILALVIPFVGSLLIGPKLIAVLRAMKAGQPIREARKGVLAPEHSSKVGTPTMGGLMLIGLVLLTSSVSSKIFLRTYFIYKVISFTIPL